MAQVAEKNETDNVTRPAQFAKDQLKTIIERIERLEEDKKAVKKRLADLWGQASQE